MLRWLSQHCTHPSIVATGLPPCQQPVDRLGQWRSRPKTGHAHCTMLRWPCPFSYSLADLWNHFVKNRQRDGWKRSELILAHDGSVFFISRWVEDTAVLAVLVDGRHMQRLQFGEWVILQGLREGAVELGFWPSAVPIISPPACRTVY